MPNFKMIFHLFVIILAFVVHSFYDFSPLLPIFYLKSIKLTQESKNGTCKSVQRIFFVHVLFENRENEGELQHF